LLSFDKAEKTKAEESSIAADKKEPETKTYGKTDIKNALGLPHIKDAEPIIRRYYSSIGRKVRSTWEIKLSENDYNSIIRFWREAQHPAPRKEPEKLENGLNNALSIKDVADVCKISYTAARSRVIRHFKREKISFNARKDRIRREDFLEITRQPGILEELKKDIETDIRAGLSPSEIYKRYKGQHDIRPGALRGTITFLAKRIRRSEN